MTDEELKQLQQDMYRDAIEVPEDQEKELISVAREVSNKLYFHPSHKASFSYLGHDYVVVNYQSIVTLNFKKAIRLVIDDLTEQRRIRTDAEVDNSLSELENVRAAVGAALRHHTEQAGVVGEIPDEE